MKNETDKLLAIYRGDSELFFAMKCLWTSDVIRIISVGHGLRGFIQREYYFYILRFEYVTVNQMISEFYSQYIPKRAAKQLSLVLCRMVKRGYIVRVKKGCYAVNFQCKKVAEINHNQLNLFTL